MQVNYDFYENLTELKFDRIIQIRRRKAAAPNRDHGGA